MYSIFESLVLGQSSEASLGIVTQLSLLLLQGRYKPLTVPVAPSKERHRSFALSRGSDNAQVGRRGSSG